MNGNTPKVNNNVSGSSNNKININSEALNKVDDVAADLIPDKIGNGKSKAEQKAEKMGVESKDIEAGTGKKKEVNMTSQEKEEALKNGGISTEDSSTKKLVRTAGRGVAAYATGGQSLGEDQKIVNSRTGDKLIGVVSDQLDRNPGVEKVAKAIDDVGVTDAAEGVMDIVGSVKNKDADGLKEGAKKAEKGAKKLTKAAVIGFLMSIVSIFFVLIIGAVTVILLASPILGLFLDLTSGDEDGVDIYESAPEGSTHTGDDVSLPGPGGNDPWSGDEVVDPGSILESVDYGDYLLDSSNSTILQEPLATFLKRKGSSLEEFNDKIQSNIIEHGCGTREGVVAAAVSLIGELNQAKYDYKKLPYSFGGGHGGQRVGADGTWGSETKKTTVIRNETRKVYKGLDCSGFVGWAIYNGGYKDVTRGASAYAKLGTTVGLNKSQAVVGAGDLLVGNGHVVLVIGVEGNNYLVAEAGGMSAGVHFSKYKFGRDGYSGVKMDSFYNNSSNKRGSC